MKTIRSALYAFTSLTFALTTFGAGPLPPVDNVEWQPLSAQIRRLVEALNYQGAPLSSSDQEKLDKLLASPVDKASDKLQELLDPYCLLFVNINPESRVKVAHGPAP